MITTKLIFDRRGWVKQKKKGIIEVRVTFERKTIYISTGVCVRKGEWAAGQIVNRPDAEILNKRIIAIYERVSQEADKCVKQGVKLDTESVKQEICKIAETYSTDPTFINWIEQQIPLLGVSDGTTKHYEPLVTRLTEWGQMTRWQDVTVENVSNFDAWLHTVTKPLSDARKKKGVKPEKLSDGGIYNYHKCLKALLNRAKSFRKIDANPYEFLRGKFKRGDKENIEYLTDEEMRKFEAIILPANSELDIAHDLFIFQMYTGLSFSDAQAFDFDEYKWDGSSYRHVGSRIKTGCSYVSTLLPPVVNILCKYDGEVPKINNADYNKQLKALGLMAGIKTRLHSHLARHTFATWMLRNGASIENVSKMLGHTNITQTQRYAKVIAQSVHDDFDKVSEKIWKKRKENMESGRKKRGKGG